MARMFVVYSVSFIFLQGGALFVAFPQEEGKHPPNRCRITYLGQGDTTITKSSEGTRTADPYVVQTWKPSKNMPCM